MDKFIIRHPLISEKATDLGNQGKYVFLVGTKAAGPEIKKALESIYKINIVKLNVINIKPKQKKWKGSVGVKAGYKKAIVTLKKGQKLDILPH